MQNISGPLALVDKLEEEIEEALRALEATRARLKQSTATALALAQLFDTSLARLSIALELDEDWQTVKNMIPRLREQAETSIVAIREAIQS